MKQREDNRFHWRLAVLNVAAFLFFVLLIARLGYIQFLEKESLEVIAERQYKCEVKLFPQRGLVLDRQLRPLAMNVPAVSVLAYPELITDPLKTSRVLSQVLGRSASHYSLRLQNPSRVVTLAWNVSREQGERLAAIGLPGIELQESWSRRYPRGRVGSQILGFIDVDGNGLSGIEKSCDALLRGKAGKAILQKTASGGTSQLFERPEYPKLPPVDGSDVVLTLDYFYQSIIERNLSQTIVETQAESGAVVVMDPTNGEILAMASEPNFDPNSPSDFHPSAQRM
ncbi:hypothetical protein JW992_05610, partial [candidate division KSB1 bacterium]|nr:hypothetical protein [candidate division KSB1 bacterium]